MIRLFIASEILPGTPIQLCAEQNHYLSHVMRCTKGNTIFIFNGKQGLWESSFECLHRKQSLLIPIKSIQTQPTLTQHISLFFSPIKRQNWLIEKATELGVTDFFPILCRRSIIKNFSEKRMNKIIIEACEQSECLSIPRIHPLQDFSSVFKTFSGECLFFLDLKATLSLSKALQSLSFCPSLGLCLGPEGGWDPKEQEKAISFPFIRHCTLGKRPLRAETAGLAGISILFSSLTQQ